jgi:uncharacterized protein YbjQ (UPF0145 family)
VVVKRGSLVVERGCLDSGVAIGLDKHEEVSRTYLTLTRMQRSAEQEAISKSRLHAQTLEAHNIVNYRAEHLLYTSPPQSI